MLESLNYKQQRKIHVLLRRYTVCTREQRGRVTRNINDVLMYRSETLNFMDHFQIIDPEQFATPDRHVMRDLFWREVAKVLCGENAYVEYSEAPEKRYVIGPSETKKEYVITLKSAINGGLERGKHYWYLFNYGNPLIDHDSSVVDMPGYESYDSDGEPSTAHVHDYHTDDTDDEKTNPTFTYQEYSSEPHRSMASLISTLHARVCGLEERLMK